jgi:general secretion pathway protein L
MARVLGLDLGSWSVKAVLFETTMRGYTTRAYGEARRAAEGDKVETLRAALTELFGRQPMPADQVVVALPGPALATHVLTLPFTDTKRIEATIPFEVESQLPFDLSAAVYDYQIASVKEKKASELLICVVRKDELQALLDALAPLKLDPRVVTHPGLAFQSLMALRDAEAALAGPDEQAQVILDIGHERTSIALGRPSLGVEFARTFPGGGINLTRSLANEFQMPLPAAAEWKEQHGAVGEAAVGPDAERASNAFIRGLQPILRELRPSLKAWGGRTRASISQIHLCGGSARLPGLDAQLAKDLGIPCKLLALPEESKTLINPPDQPAAAQAYALALRGQASGAKAPRFNLRRGDFGFKGDFDFVKDKFPLLAAFAGVLLVLLIASGVVRNSLLSRREAKLDEALCDVTKRVLGKCEKDADRALNLLRGKESPAAAIPRLSAVNLLAEVTSRMPADVPITLDQIVVDTDRISLKVVTDSANEVDKITAALKQFKCFKGVSEGKVEKSKDGKKVDFRLDIEVECPEQQEPRG